MSNVNCIAVQPESHPWHAAMCQAVRRGGGEVTQPSAASGMIWLVKHEENVSDTLTPNLKWIQLRSAGVEHWVDAGDIRDDRIFTCARGVYSEAVAEHVMALLLAASRRLHACSRSRTWDRESCAGARIAGSTVAILGAGGIGGQVISYLKPFGVRIIAITNSGRRVAGAEVSLSSANLSDVWAEADFVVVSAPATAETTAMIGASQISAMKPTAWIINVARGSLIDTSALVDGLRDGEIAGAALDVTDPEPLPDHHELWTLPNVLITPHVANPVASQQVELERRVEENVRRFIAGEELLGVIDASRGY